MVVELTPDSAPIWLNVIIWMGVFWQYILIGFVPAFYIAITKLFGFPMLQRWSSEIVIMLYPNKVKFGKVTQQYEPYFRYRKGVYWLDSPLQPTIVRGFTPKVQNKLVKIKERYELIANKPEKTEEEEKEIESLLKQQIKLEKQIMEVSPANQIHIFTHAVNQPVYRMERRESKVDEILNNDANPKKIAAHNIWIMQNPKLHFHRHYQVIVDPNGKLYQLIPVKEKQQFGIGFWHSIGIVLQKEVETEQETEIGSGGGQGKQLVQATISTHIILQQMKEVQDYQNFSASRAYMLLKRRLKIEENFMYWITGSFNMKLILLMVGLIASVAVVIFFLHGNGPPTVPGGK